MEEITIRKELRPLTIDPEFRDIIPPLMDEERRMLEDSIVANGCETPLTVWNNTIVDGHNRYDICQEHGIPFAIMEKEFDNRDEACPLTMTSSRRVTDSPRCSTRRWSWKGRWRRRKKWTRWSWRLSL